MIPSSRLDPAARAALRSLVHWLGAFRPARTSVNWRERLRVVCGAALGILIAALLCRALGAFDADLGAAWPWLVAPLGASAVLVFGVPASPLAQPWSVVGGNTLSALVGIACVNVIGAPEWAAAIAVGAAIGLMFALRCLHPPGGAAALLVALAGISDPRFALFPVLANSLILASVGIVYNHATGRAYPHRQRREATATARDESSVDADLDAVLAHYNQVLDISRDDLKALLEDTQLRAYQRKLADIRCGDIMSSKLVTVSHRTPLGQAWALFRRHRIKVLPVVDLSGAVVGIVTPVDFIRMTGADAEDDFARAARKVRDWDRGDAASEHDVVGRIMTRRVQVARVDRHLVDLIPLFGSTGHHHIPIIGERDKLVGIITQSDVVAALTRSAAPPT